MNCENCLKEIDGSYGSGRFCNRVCSCTFVSKQNREIKNQKISISLTNEKQEKECLVCKNKFILKTNKKLQTTCSIKCAGVLRWKNEQYRDGITTHIRNRCKSPTEKKRLRDIGRKGGFGNKGTLENGTRYSSNFEKECFEFLIENKISFIPHKNIPNSSKVSDIYFEEKDIYIELDGINRNKRQRWLEKEYRYWLDKLEIYKKENLNYKILYNIEEFKNFISIEF